MPKRNPDSDIRDSYGIFKLEYNGEIADYHLAVAKIDESKPTAAEMTAGALKRNLSTNAINVLIAQRLDAPMITFAEKFFNDATADLGETSMISDLDDNENAGFVYDNDATGNDAWVRKSILESGADYKLYGMPDGGSDSDVMELTNFSTDPTLTLGGTGVTGNKLKIVDSTLEKGYISISIRSNELYIFPVQTDFEATRISDYIGVHYYFLSRDPTQVVFNLQGSLSLWGRPSVENVIFIVKDISGDTASSFTIGNYILMRSDEFPIRFTLVHGTFSNPAEIEFSNFEGR